MRRLAALLIECIGREIVLELLGSINERSSVAEMRRAIDDPNTTSAA